MLRTVKIQANTNVFLLTANSPITHVRPSRGRSITDALMVALRGRDWRKGEMKQGRREGGRDELGGWVGGGNVFCKS